jgi:hypothetical protein
MTVFRLMPGTASEIILRDIKQRERLRVPVVCIAQDGYLWYLEIVGSEQATRAIWSNVQVSQNARTDGLLSTQCSFVSGAVQEKLMIPSKTKYLMTSKVQENWTRMAIMNPGISKIHYQMIIGGTTETPSPWFASALTKINVPVKMEWLPWFWQAAQKARLITEPDILVGFRMWHVDQRPKEWQNLATRYVQEVING